MSLDRPWSFFGMLDEGTVGLAGPIPAGAVRVAWRSRQPRPLRIAQGESLPDGSLPTPTARTRHVQNGSSGFEVHPAPVGPGDESALRSGSSTDRRRSPERPLWPI